MEEQNEAINGAGAQTQVHPDPKPQQHAAKPAYAQKPNNPKRFDYGKYASKFVNKTTVSALVLYAIIALIVFNPVFSHISTTVPGTGGDSFLNLWEIWWTGYALSTHASLYYTYSVFWPVGANLIYQTISPLTGIISLPFQAFGLVTAYNITLLIGILISAFGMFVLAKYITKNAYAAFLAGLFYAFSATHVAQSYSHMNWVDIGFIPVLLYFLLRSLYGEGGKHAIYKNAAGIGISFVLITFLGGYEKAIMSIMLSVLVVVVYLVYELYYKQSKKFVLSKSLWITIILGMVIAFVLGSWGFIPLIHTLTQKGGISSAQYLNNVTYNEGWSNNLLSFFVPSYYNGIFNPGAKTSYFAGTFQSDPTEKIGYIGYMPLLLAIAGIYYDIKAKRKRYLLWLSIAIFFGWLSLGPYVQIGSKITSIPTIYIIYHAIHGLNVIREPGRFLTVGTIGLDILAAIGITEIISKDKLKILRNKKYNIYAIIAIAAVLFIIGSSGIPHTSATASIVSTPVPSSSFYKELSTVNTTFSVLQLPILEDVNSSQPLLYEGLANYGAALSKKPFIGGYFGRENTTQLLSLYNIPLTVEVQNLIDGNGFNYTSPVNENYTNESLFTMYSYNTEVLAIQKHAFSSSDLLGIEDYFSSIFGNPIYNGNNTMAFATKSEEASVLNNSYISYPYLPDWTEYGIAYNGSDYNMFLPIYPGPITVYAPIYNSTNTTKRNSVDNTTVSFYAIGAYNGSSVKVIESTTSGYKDVANFTINKAMQRYSFNMDMVAGQANPLLFISSQSNNVSTVLINDIKFSKA
ncbi:MAG: hypothetical protein M1544_02890 [Candidatus Marsarchaeota archaeon]|nr:hypothetical protein [Candidatus Marsarchaeota archaeon]